MANWEAGYNNTKTFEVFGTSSREFHDGCRNCNAITPIENLFQERQLLGNVYQSLATCSVCKLPLIVDEYKLRYRPTIK